MTGSLDDALTKAAAGGQPDTIALMRVLIEAATEEAARDGFERAKALCTSQDDKERVTRLEGLQRLWRAHPDAWRLVRSTIEGIEHRRDDSSPDETLRYWATAFDRLAAQSPEASVALYSLGSPDLLAAATDEIVARLDEWALLGPDRDAVDLGCGIGRFLLALAPRLRRIRGLDISTRMVAEAARRCRAVPTISVEQGTGRDLATVPDLSADLVLAADVFPYLVQAGGGLAEKHIAECARILRPGGAALILNYAYSGNIDAQRREVADLATKVHLKVERNGSADFALWDGRTFLLRKP